MHIVAFLATQHTTVYLDNIEQAQAICIIFFNEVLVEKANHFKCECYIRVL